MSETIKRGESAKFSPEQGKYSGVRPFRNWVQTVLPQVYDDALSYQELFYKMLWYINTLIEDVDTVEENVSSLKDAYDSLETYLNNALDGFVTEINNYYDNLDIQGQVNAKFDELVEDGTLSRLIEPLIPVVETDTTLTQEGVPADAQATGTYCLTCYRTLIDSSNYESNLTDANDCSVNVIYNIDKSVTEDMIANLPTYKSYAIRNMTLITFSGDNTTKFQIAYYMTGEVFIRSGSNTSYSEWVRIDPTQALRAYGTTINSTNYSAVTSSTANYIYFIDTSVTADMIPNLPSYGSVMTLIRLNGYGGYYASLLFTRDFNVYLSVPYGNVNWVKLFGNNNRLVNENIEYFKNLHTCVFKPINLNENSHIYFFNDMDMQEDDWTSILCEKIGCNHTTYNKDGDDYAAFAGNYLLNKIENVEDWNACTLVIINEGETDIQINVDGSEYTSAIQNVIDAVQEKTDAHIVFITPKRNYLLDKNYTNSYPNIIKYATCIANTALHNKCSVINAYDFPLATTTDSDGFYSTFANNGYTLSSEGNWAFACSVLNALI